LCRRSCKHRQWTAGPRLQALEESDWFGLAKLDAGVRLVNSMVAAGHSILQDINLTITPGEHIAIVGPSGAGKSSFVGLLLGWHRLASGAVLVDGLKLNGANQQALRQETAWVDPAVQIGNRSFLDNLCYSYSSRGDSGFDLIASAIGAAALRGVSLHDLKKLKMYEPFTGSRQYTKCKNFSFYLCCCYRVTVQK
jgi:ABC-type multidrug transport system fused ATPase/permease subunit